MILKFIIIKIDAGIKKNRENENSRILRQFIVYYVSKRRKTVSHKLIKTFYLLMEEEL